MNTKGRRNVCPEGLSPSVLTASLHGSVSDLACCRQNFVKRRAVQATAWITCWRQGLSRAAGRAESRVAQSSLHDPPVPEHLAWLQGLGAAWTATPTAVQLIALAAAHGHAAARRLYGAASCLQHNRFAQASLSASRCPHAADSLIGQQASHDHKASLMLLPGSPNAFRNL